MSTECSADANSEFYVGYLGMPRSYRRFVQIAAPVAIVVMMLSAALLSSNQPEWGTGVWDLSSPYTFVGVARAEPYPSIEIQAVDAKLAGRGLEGERHLLVLPGKVGAQEAILPFVGQRVAVTGYQLMRDDRRIIEIDMVAPQPIEVLEGDAPPAMPLVFSPSETTIDGEILDSKCFIGAMKPGYGRGHKACAINCVSSGIAPMIISTDLNGQPIYTILVDERGDGLKSTALDAILPVIGEPVRLTGRVGQAGMWRYIAIDPNRGIELR